MATTVKDFFERRAPEALAANPSRAKDVAATYLFKITGPEGGVWTADLLASPATCTPGSTVEPGCTIEVSDTDFCAMIDGGAAAAMQVLMAGRLKVTGNPALIAKLMGVLQLGK